MSLTTVSRFQGILSTGFLRWEKYQKKGRGNISVQNKDQFFGGSNPEKKIGMLFLWVYTTRFFSKVTELDTLMVGDYKADL